ncbi:MAG: aminoglycoside phosphotransferase family protein [Deltaproteobacteria bacterium]|nr:aminoglycoside phosphotransferase family protein [Deltaproteobacteria bacterium]
MTVDHDVGAAVRVLLNDSSATLTGLPGGANNRVWVVDGAGGRFLAKASPPRQANDRDRTRCELAFSSFLWAHGVRCVPRPIAANLEHGIGIYEYVDGIGISVVDAPLVAQAVEFARCLFELSKEDDARALMDAADARFSIDGQLSVVDARVQRLIAADLDDDAGAFVRSALVPAWKQVHEEALASPVIGILPARLRVLSPSDFGFHNALQRADGRVIFFDFEYAGWDDPAKMLVDVFLQPAVRVHRSNVPAFADAITAPAPADRSVVVERAHALFPVLRIKWTTILLNELLPDAWARRVFAGRGDRSQRIAEQIARARTLLSSSDRLEEPA